MMLLTILSFFNQFLSRNSKEKEPKLLSLPPEVLMLIFEKLDLDALLNLYSVIYKPAGSEIWRKDLGIFRFRVSTLVARWNPSDILYELIVEYIRKKLGPGASEAILNRVLMRIQFNNYQDICKISRLLLTTPVFYEPLLEKTTEEVVNYFIGRDESMRPLTAYQSVNNFLSAEPSESFEGYDTYEDYERNIAYYEGYKEEKDIARLLFLAFLSRLERRTQSIEWLKNIPKNDNTRNLLEDTRSLAHNLCRNKKEKEIAFQAFGQGEFFPKETLEHFIRVHQLQELLSKWPLESAPIMHSAYLVYAMLLRKCSMLDPTLSRESIQGPRP